MASLAAILLAALAALALDSPGVALYRARKFPEAERELRASLQKQPRNPELRLLLARTLIQLNRIDQALAELDYLVGHGASPNTEMEAGRLLRILAEKRFRDLGRSDAGQAAVSEIAGRRLEHDGNFAAALARYQDARQREPDRPGLSYSMGSVLWKMRDYEGAEKNLRAELEHTPDHGMANFRLGQVLLATSREGESVTCFERAAAAMPDRTEVRRELGKAYRKAGRPADAQAAWEAVAKAHPTDDQVHFLLGGLYRELGKAALAQREFGLHRQLLEQRRNRAERP
ncbi:MAG TPA: tetratricopeptide repeat protein [Bryobacteraceae bacterium]|nr:tetratricopeptide repeat protein [Bryobacteraceae bacterium]